MKNHATAGTLAIIALCALLFVYPIFTTSGIWKTFDAPFHVSMIAQFHHALSYFHIPVVWTEGVANYGLPFGIIAHPLTSYLGGLLTFVTKDPLVSYKILWFVFSFITTASMYRLLRRWTHRWPALTGALFYTLTAYHILNLYVRGALPEFAAAAWLPFLMDSLFEEYKKRKPLRSLLILTGLFALILFTHPMYLLFSVCVAGLFLVYFRPPKQFWLVVLASVGVAIALNAFYLLPLTLEMKYFYMGQEKNFLAKGSGMSLQQFFIEEWEYTCRNGDSPAYRCNRIQTGLPESLVLLAGFALLLHQSFQVHKKILKFVLFAGIIATILLIQPMEPLYEMVSILGSIQFIYRFLNVWTLFPPIVLALFLESLPRYKKVIIPLCILGILVLRVPQVYLKNVTNPPVRSYYFNKENVHSIMMSTVWMGDSNTYTQQPSKAAFVAGKGKIISSQRTPTEHRYEVRADTKSVFADYTFYFPGWKAYIDAKEVPIQWQDPSHRGYITFPVPAGEHTVKTVFTDTKVRAGGKIISVGMLVGYGALALYAGIRRKS